MEFADYRFIPAHHAASTGSQLTMPTLSEVVAALKDRFVEVTDSEFRDQTRVVVPQSQCFAALSCLKEEHGFDMLVDVTCVDYLNFRDAIGSVRSCLRACRHG